VNLRDPRLRLLIVVPLFAAAIALFVFHGPDWHAVRRVHGRPLGMGRGGDRPQPALGAHARVRVGHGDQAVDRQAPSTFGLVFSAFSVGLFANAVLPGRVGELARVAVLRRHLPGRRGTTVTLLGSVVAHRMFDLFPAIVLVVWVLFTAKLPGWALTSIGVVLSLGAILFVTRWRSRGRPHGLARRHGRVRAIVNRGRQGLP
jgi:Uncharacterised protein family (UPF0104).